MQYENVLHKHNISEERIERIVDELEWFQNKVIDSHSIRYLNGFTSVGILEIPEDHITPSANTIWIYGIGSNTDDSEIEVNQNIYLTEEEAEDLYRSLKIVLKLHKKYYKKLKKKDIQYDNIPRERI